MTWQKFYFSFFILTTLSYKAAAQDTTSYSSDDTGWFSLGGRNTFSAFSDDGTGLGTGGQFRIQLSNKVNTDWFADYIVVSNDKNVKSVYYHIGWSVLYYPFYKFPRCRWHPYVLAGHCFDYNKKIIINNPSINKDRWGSAVQMGLGANFNITDRFDITLMSQYMIHLTKELEVKNSGGNYTIEKKSGTALEGHLLTTLSINYKIFKLWKK